MIITVSLFVIFAVAAKIVKGQQIESRKEKIRFWIILYLSANDAFFEAAVDRLEESGVSDKPPFDVEQLAVFVGRSLQGNEAPQNILVAQVLQIYQRPVSVAASEHCL